MSEDALRALAEKGINLIKKLCYAISALLTTEYSAHKR